MTDEERLEDIRNDFHSGVSDWTLRPGDGNWLFWYIDKLKADVKELRGREKLRHLPENPQVMKDLKKGIEAYKSGDMVDWEDVKEELNVTKSE